MPAKEAKATKRRRRASSVSSKGSAARGDVGKAADRAEQVDVGASGRWRDLATAAGCPRAWPLRRRVKLR